MTVQAFLFRLVQLRSPLETAKDCPVGQLTGPRLARTGPNGEDLGGATYDTRVSGTRTLDTRKKLDERDVLFTAILDLRSVVRKLNTSE